MWTERSKEWANDHYGMNTTFRYEWRVGNEKRDQRESQQGRGDYTIAWGYEIYKSWVNPSDPS